MGDFFRGTSSEQDSRFSDKNKKYIQSTRFPPEFEKPIDLNKITMDAIRPWITKRITELIGFEDDVLINFIFTFLEPGEIGKGPDPKELQHHVEGFLDENAPIFVKELWQLLLSAQETIGGIPKQFLEEKKELLRKRKEEEERIRNEIRTNIEKRRGINKKKQKRRKEEIIIIEEHAFLMLMLLQLQILSMKII